MAADRRSRPGSQFPAPGRGRGKRPERGSQRIRELVSAFDVQRPQENGVN